MKKKIISTLLCTAMLATMVAGCGVEKSDGGSDTESSASSVAEMKQTGKIVVKFQRRGKPTNSALLESHYQSEHLQDIGMSRPICCYTSK